jgi:hypothetical protein
VVVAVAVTHQEELHQEQVAQVAVVMEVHLQDQQVAREL